MVTEHFRFIPWVIAGWKPVVVLVVGRCIEGSMWEVEAEHIGGEAARFGDAAGD
jgi:hypothetical protein